MWKKTSSGQEQARQCKNDVENHEIKTNRDMKSQNSHKKTQKRRLPNGNIAEEEKRKEKDEHVDLRAVSLMKITITRRIKEKMFSPLPEPRGEARLSMETRFMLGNKFPRTRSLIPTGEDSGC